MANRQDQTDSGSPLPPGIIVMGPYRCATSYLSHVLASRGVDFGPLHEMYEADEWNPYGYFQRPDVLHANNALQISAGHSAFAPADLHTLRTRENVAHLYRADLQWRYASGIWGIKDPRFCTTLKSWADAGLLGENVGLIRIRREPLDSARSLLKHPELAAQLGDATLEAALKVILRYEQLANEQVQHFSGAILSLNFKDVTRNPDQCLRAIDMFIASLMSSAAKRKLEMV